MTTLNFFQIDFIVLSLWHFQKLYTYCADITMVFIIYVHISVYVYIFIYIYINWNWCIINLGFGNGQDTEGFLNTGVSLGCSYYFHTKACSQMTSGGDLCHVWTSKLICEINRWTGPCVMQFLLEGRSEHTMIHY